MIHTIFKRVAPLAALALGATLAGCNYSVDWGKVEGVPLAELDTSGDAPTRITLAGPDSVVITEGDALTIELEGSEEAGEALRFDRDGERLTIARDREVYDGRDKAVVRIAMPAPERLSIAGSGTITSDSMASDARIEIAGSGSITATNLAAEKLRVDIAGSGSVSGSGTADELHVEIAGSGGVSLGELMADDVEVEIAGSGNVDLASNGSVDASIAGSGNITVTGSANCSVSTAGSGTLTCRPAPDGAEATEEEGEAEEASAD